MSNSVQRYLVPKLALKYDEREQTPIVTNREDYTSDYLILELQRRGVDYIRFNTEFFPQRIQVVWRLNEHGASGYFVFPGRQAIGLHDIESIWYRRPVAPVAHDTISPVTYEFISAESRETLAGVWRTLDCFWVSHPDRIQRAEVKLYQLAVAKHIGFKIPATIITNDPEQARQFYETHKGNLIYKPLRHSRIIRGEKVSLIYTNPISEDIAEQLHCVQYAPTLLQRYIPKSFEIRVTVIGCRVFAVALYSQDSEKTQHDWCRGDMRDLRHEPYQLTPCIEDKCISLVKSLGLAFGAIDLIFTPDGECHLL